MTLEDVRATVSFNITIELASGNRFRARYTLDFPGEELFEEGILEVRITDLSDMIFRRV